MLIAFRTYTHCGACLLLVVAAQLSGCGDGQATQQAKQTIQHGLSDPLSVQYRNVVEHQGGVVCGEYNAKNKMGGYVGFAEFIFNAPKLGDMTFTPKYYETFIWCNQDSFESKKAKQAELDTEASICSSRGYDSEYACRSRADFAIAERRARLPRDSSAQIDKASTQKK